jgi:hypothetical protein
VKVPAKSVSGSPKSRRGKEIECGGVFARSEVCKWKSKIRSL